MEFPPTNATLTRLDSGLRLILLPDPSAPVVSVQAWVETGSVHEGRWLGAGMSHLLEHMVFKGTRSFNSEQLAQTVQAAGGQWNAYTTYDRTVYYIDGPADSTQTFLKALGEMVFHPSLPKSEFEREKDVIRREIEMGLDSPGQAAHRLLFETLYHRDARRHPVIGHRERFDLISHKDLVDFHHQHYTPNQITLCLVGDFDPILITEQAEDLTAGLAPGSLEFQQAPQEPPQQGRRFAEDEFDIPVSKLTLAWRAPSLESPDSPAMDLLASILGQGRSSILYRTHREGSGLAQEIGAWTYQSRDLDGLFAISAECEPEQTASLTHALLEQVSALDESSLEPHLSRVKKAALSSQFGTLTTASGRASDLAKNWHEARNLDFTRDYLAALEKVSAFDLLRVRNRWLNDRQLSVTVLNPKGTKKTAKAKKIQPTRGAPELHTLKNGMRLILIPDRRIPLVAGEIIGLGGTAVESSQQAGIGTLMASSLLKGTASRSAEEIAAHLEELGGSINAFSGHQTFGLKLAFLKDDLDTSLDLAADLLSGASFPEAAVERERKSQLSNLREKLSDPLSVAFLRSRAGIFHGSAYVNSSLGTESTLGALTRQDLTEHLKRLRNPQNLVIALAGDIDSSETLEKAEAHFAELPLSYQSIAPPEIPAPQSGAMVEELAGKKQAVLTIAFPGLPIKHLECPALDLFTAYASDMAGPLFTRIREELGLAYYVSVNAFSGINSGSITFYLGTSPEQLDLARTELQGQIEKLAAEGIPKDAFERTRNNHLAALALSQQSNRAVAHASALNSLLGLGHDYHLHIAERIAAITPDEVGEMMNRLLNQDPFIVSVVPKA